MEPNQSNGSGITFLPADAGHSATLTIDADSDTAPNAATTYMDTTPISSATTTFHPRSMINPTTPSYDPILSVSYDTIYLKIALHELGHTMGLDHLPGAGCLQQNGGSIMNWGCGTNDMDNALPTSITPCDNGVVQNSVYPPPPCDNTSATSYYTSSYTGSYGESCTAYHQVVKTYDCHGTLLSTDDQVTSTQCQIVCWESGSYSWQSATYTDAYGETCYDDMVTPTYSCSDGRSYESTPQWVDTVCYGGGGGGISCTNDSDCPNGSTCDLLIWECWFIMDPILVDVTGDGYALTDFAHGVIFNGGGRGLRQMSWTDPAHGNAWLVLDRNRNGFIDNGSELFGNYAPQLLAAGVPPNGFAALAVFDRPDHGGNGNGLIDAGDAIFKSLGLWIDSNQNGISEPNELRTLSGFGIAAFDLYYKRSERVDRYGNRFRYRAAIIDSDGTSNRHRTIWDVVLLTSDSPSIPAPPSLPEASTVPRLAQSREGVPDLTLRMLPLRWR